MTSGNATGGATGLNLSVTAGDRIAIYCSAGGVGGTVITASVGFVSSSVAVVGTQGPQGAQGADAVGYNVRFSTWWGLPGVFPIAFQEINFLGADTAYYQPILVEKQITVTDLMVNVSTAGGAGAAGRLSIYEADEDDWQPGALVSDCGTVAVATTGTKSITGLSVTLAPGLYLARYQTDGNATRPRFRGNRAFVARATMPQTDTDQYRYTAQVGVTYGAAEDPGTAFGTSASSSSSTFCYWVRMKWTT